MKNRGSSSPSINSQGVRWGRALVFWPIGFGMAALGIFGFGASFAPHPAEKSAESRGSSNGEEALTWQARCRRWRRGDLRMGLREAWCWVRGVSEEKKGELPRGLAIPRPDEPVEGGNHTGPTAGTRDFGGGSKENPQNMSREKVVPTWPAGHQPSGKLEVAGHGMDRAALHAATREEFFPPARPDPPGAWNLSAPRLLALRVAPSFGQVRRYFEEALGERPVQELQGRVRFERREHRRWGVSWRRGILDAPAGGVRLQWFVNDDFGMSELREFFEAPFFFPAETEQFYRWLGRWGWHEAPFRRGTVWMGVLPGDGLIFVEIFWRESDSGPIH